MTKMIAESIQELETLMGLFAEEAAENAAEIKSIVTRSDVPIADRPILIDIQSRLLSANVNAVKKLAEMLQRYYQ